MENFIFKSSNSIRGNTAKRWLHLLSFFMLLCFGQIGFAQTGTVQIGSGSVSSAADQRIPVANYVYNYSQQIVTAAEYAAGGGVSGPITKIRYQTTSLGTLSVWNNWTVYIGNTNKTSFASSSDWVPVNQLTQVFSGTITPNPVNNQWFEIVFSQPFNYTGGNIVIAVDENTSGWTSAPDFLSYTSTSNSGIMYRNDSTNPNPSSPPTATYRVSILPQIQFEGTLASCLPPTGLSLSKTSLTSLDASWIGDAESYQIAINTSATPPVSGSGPLYGNTASAGNLITGETYYLHIRSICDGEFSGWATSSPLLLDYCVSYPTYSADTKITTLTLGNDVRPGVAGATTYTNRTAEAPLVIQQAVPTFFSLTAGSSTTDQYAAYSKVFIDLNKDGDFDDEGELIFQDSHATTPTTERTQTGTITIPVSETSLGNTRLRIVLRESGDSTTTVACGTYGYGETQDYTVSITAAPSCLPPTTLTATAITTNTASLGWASAGNNFDIKWGTSGFNFATEGTLVTGQTSPYSLGGLSPATAYQFYVRQNCGGGDLSQWAGPFSFTTACALPDTPTTITFSAVTTTATTINWIAPENAPTGYVVFRSTSNIPPVLVNSTTYVTNQTTAIAALTTEGRTYFCVYNGTALLGTASSLTANTQYYYYVYSRNGQNSCSGAPWYSLTALSGSQTTYPTAPTAFTSNPSFTSATVGWTAPAGGSAGAYTYSIEVATDSGYINQITGSPFSTTSSSLNLTTLSQGTFYYVRVIANNGIANSTALTGNFTTLIAGQIGTGTGAAALFPIRSGSNFSYTQQIYTKAQIEERLEENQNYITSIRFYYNGNGTSATPGTVIATTNIQNWAVYLGNTNKDLFSNTTDWVAVGNMEQVFSGNVTFPAPGNWMEIFLDTPFQWDGESNIVVGVDENSTGNIATANFRTFASGANRGIGITGTNNIDPTTPGTGTTPTGTIAQISFGAIETPDCEPVTGVVVSSITPYTANVTWTGNGEYYILEYGVSGFTLGTGTLLEDTDNPTSLEGLLSETNYHVYVRQMCGSNESPWIGPITFTTAISCPAPTAGTTTQITGKSATLNWTSAEGNFIINWGTGTFNPGAGANTQAVSGTSFTFPNNLTSSTTYRWYVRRDCSGTNDGLSAWAGPYTFTTRYLNDMFVDAIPVSCGQTYTGSTATATNDQPNPAVFTVESTLSPNVWYSYTGTGQPQQINLSLCESAYDTAILVATGTAGNLTWVAGNDDSCGVSGHRSQVEFTSNGTTTYWIMVRGYGVTSTGAYELVVTCTEACTPATTNDECSTAATLTLGTPLATGNQCATPSDVNYPTCSGGNQFSSHFDSWYSFNSGASGQVSVSIAVESGEVGFAVYSGSCGTTMTAIACIAPTATSNSALITVQPNTNYFVRAYSNSTTTRGIFTLAVNSFCIPGEWTGTTSSAWATTSNWCGSAAPTTLSNILIKADRPNYPVISSNVTIGSLSVQNGASLTVNSNTLTVGTINVATGGNMTVKSGATLWQDANTVNTGNVTIQRNVTLQHLDYTVWSSPVVGQALQAFSPNTLPNRIRDYVNNVWTAVPNVNANFTAGKGYMFRAPNVFDPEFYPNAYSWTGSFTGVPQTADEVIVPFTIASNHQSVGNPYPTSIHADAFFDENDPGFANNSGTDILGAMYIWMTDRSDIAATGGDAWALYNPITGGTNPGGGAPHNGIIPAGQGFLLRTRKPIAQLPSVKFTTDMRINAAGTFYRSNTVERHRLWLNLANQETVLNQTLVAYVEGATQGFDASIDTEALSNNGTALYSLVPNNTDSFMIQGRALPFNDLDVVPMGFRAANAGTYTISLANFDGVFADGQDIFLVDNLNQVTHNLKEASYTFVSESGEFNSRFSVVYRQDALSVTNPDLNNNWVVYPKNGQFQIETLGFEMKQVIVYDMLGRTVYQSKADGNNHLVDAINANQVLIVKVVTTDNVVLTKKINN